MSTSQQNARPSNSISGTQAMNEQAAAQTLARLIDNVQCGNVSGAKTNLSTLTQQAEFNAATDASSPLGALLTELVGSLGSGNIAAARSNVQAFHTALQGGTSGTYTGHHRNPSSGIEETVAGGILVGPAASGNSANATRNYRDPLSQAVQEESPAMAGASAASGTDASRG